MNDPPIYLQLVPGATLPDIAALAPFRAVVIVDVIVTADWRRQISEWLVDMGCRYMMAWGHDCGAWDDSVDDASLQRFDGGDVPDDASVTTTWHADESLSEVFVYCEHCASHATVELRHTVLAHIADRSDAGVIAAYHEAVRSAELS